MYTCIIYWPYVNCHWQIINKRFCLVCWNVSYNCLVFSLRYTCSQQTLNKLGQNLTCMSLKYTCKYQISKHALIFMPRTPLEIYTCSKKSFYLISDIILMCTKIEAQPLSNDCICAKIIPHTYFLFYSNPICIYFLPHYTKMRMTSGAMNALSNTLYTVMFYHNHTYE